MTNVLIVDDEDMIRMLLAEVLEGDGYICFTAANATDALKLLADGLQRIDLLISDIVMPGEMAGIGLAVEAQRRDPLLRVLLMSGYYDKDLMTEIRTHGFHVVAKPFRPQQLLEVVQAMTSC